MEAGLTFGGGIDGCGGVDAGRVPVPDGAVLGAAEQTVRVTRMEAPLPHCNNNKMTSVSASSFTTASICHSPRTGCNPGRVICQSSSKTSTTEVITRGQSSVREVNYVCHAGRLQSP